MSLFVRYQPLAIGGGGGSTLVMGPFGSSPNNNAGTIAAGTLTLQPADGTHPGGLSTGSQNIGGAKTFLSTISASNLSGTNTGDVTLTAVGSSPSANGASLSGQALTLQPADATHPGLVTILAQSFAGNKTFGGAVNVGSLDSNTAGGTLSIGSSAAAIVNIGNSGATVNIQGTTIYENTPQLLTADPLITVNHGGGAGSGQNAGIEVEENSLITGYVETSADRNSWILLAPNTAGVATITPGSSGFTINQGSHNPVTIGTANGLSLSTQVLSLALSSTSTTGALSSTDWNTFNNKQSTITTGNLTDAGTDGIVITGGTGAVIGSGTSIAQHVADSTHNGYLSSTDWSTFNNKQPTITTGNLTDVGTDGIVVTGGTGSVIGSGTSIAQHVADSTHNGYLSSTDWSTFNNKQPTITTGNLTDAGTDGIVVTGGTGSVIGSGTSIAQHVADTTHNGYLSSTDWNTFNGKGSGSVTSVALSVPATSIFSVTGSPVTTSGTLGLVTTGTSGGVPYFSSTSQLASSALLTANQLMLGGGAGAAPTSLAAGTQFQVLVMGASNPGYGQVNLGQSAAITGTLPIGNGGTGQTSAANAFGALSPLTTKGDILGYSTLNARVPVGADGSVLTADSTQTLGVKWSTASAGTVTSVAMTVPSFLSVSGSPVTTSGTLAVTLSGTALPILNGGTGQTTKSAAFDALSPMTTGGDLIYGGASGTGTRLANGSSGQYLASAGGTSAPTWKSLTVPSVQRFTSGSGTYTTPTSPAPTYIVIEAIGAGGGGGGSATIAAADGQNGAAGTDTTFGTSLITAGKGGGGLAIGAGGTGGTNTINAGPIVIQNVTGGRGNASAQSTTVPVPGGIGGSGALGGAGGGSAGVTAGTAGAANTGGGGGGAGGPGSAGISAAGGGSGGYVKCIIASPSATYSYVVGSGSSTGGSNGTGGATGGNGGSGLIVVTEYYQ